jgi:GWxTD domain-containing protein
MRRRAFLLSLALLVPVLGWAKDAAKLLPPHYRDWLTKDVAYVISKEEKDSFLQMATDADRNNFIERFWEVRNPTPGAPTNPYKVEHYKRLEEASARFSTGRAQEGWRTDMGRVYITLGPPEQKARYVVQGGVRPMEIWFYSNSHPALPPFFSVIFYEKDFGDFRLYSPYMDGPQKLVTGIQAEQGRVQSVQQIDRILGREVALTTLSLIPGEPVNVNDAESSLSSDLLLATIKNLANHPFTLDQLRLRRGLNESVTHRVMLSNDLLSVVSVPLRDRQGKVRLHYALRLTQPEDFAVAQADQRLYYSLEVLVRVLTPGGKEIFNREQKISKYLTKNDLDLVKGKPVAYEGWLPLAPGKYKIEFVFTNVLTKTAFPAEREITVPEASSQDFVITDPVPFSQAVTADPAQADDLPFTAGGVRFMPYVGPQLALVPGQDLTFFYQVWRPPASGHDTALDKFLVDYAYGRPNVAGTAQTIHEELPKSQFDTFGSEVSGKKIATTDLPQGNYRLTITLADPHSQQKRFSVLRFNIVSENPSSSDSWWINDDALAEYVTSGQADFDRALTYIAGGQDQVAAGFFQDALRENPHNERARARLIDHYFRQREFAKVVELFSQTVVTAQTEEGTVLNVADSLDKTGHPRNAVALLESALNLKPPSGPLYLALASYYQHLGDNTKAETFQQKGRSLMAETPGSSNQ